MVPVICGTSYRNKGVQKLLDAIVDYMPAPTDVPAIKGINPETDEEEVRHPSDDRAVLQLWPLRSQPTPLWVSCASSACIPVRLTPVPPFTTPLKDNNERMGRILQMHANHRQDIETVLRRRYCRCGRSEEHHHRRYPVR